jgi:endogenous inhibitor of DNA gyrase (YacG/DUF329 family)
MTRKNRTRTATRLCATCGTPFTWTSRNPRRRFCGPICKARWWRAANTDTTEPSTADNTTQPSTADDTTRARPAPTASTASTASTANDGNTTAGTTNAVTQACDRYVAGYRTEQTPSAVQNCPNCNQPIAVINLLVTPAAAYVNTPSRTVTDIS